MCPRSSAIQAIFEIHGSVHCLEKNQISHFQSLCLSAGIELTWVKDSGVPQEMFEFEDYVVRYDFKLDTEKFPVVSAEMYRNVW